MPFKCNGYNLVSEVFLTETDIIDRFVGNQLWLWGNNTNGRLGNNSTITQSSPVQTVSTGTNWEQIAAGGYHSAAVKTDGTLWLWGSNYTGQLGNNATIARSSPVQTVSTGTDWKQVSLGNAHSAAIKTDGTLWLWGAAGFGRLGNNSQTTNQSSPVQTVSTGTNWKQVSLGNDHSAAIKTDGTLWLWGSGNYGQLGNNSQSNKLTPVETVSKGTNWKQVSLGWRHSAAIKTDGTLWLWGCGFLGLLGNNSIVNRSSPVQTVSTGTNWKQVSLGRTHSAAIKIDGTLWLWGDSNDGRLGTNNVGNCHSSPVQTVSTGNNWKQVSLGFFNSSAIKTDGTLWVWGWGGCGQLGTNSTTSRSSPSQTICFGNNWKQVSFGCTHSAAVNHTDN